MKSRRDGKRGSAGVLKYFAGSDVLHFLIRRGVEARSREVRPGVTLEYDGEGRLLGVEILDASRFLQSVVLPTLTRRARHAS